MEVTAVDSEAGEEVHHEVVGVGREVSRHKTQLWKCLGWHMSTTLPCSYNMPAQHIANRTQAASAVETAVDEEEECVVVVAEPLEVDEEDEAHLEVVGVEERRVERKP